MAQNEVSFFYGQNLSSNVPFKPGAIYLDTLNKKLWYDDPSGKVAEHTVLTAPDEIYIGEGEMPETASIQILMDGSDEEQALKSELKDYINDEIEKITPKLGVDYFTENDKNIIISQIYDLIKNGGVVGFVDENKNIILNGNLTNNIYSVKYEMQDGSTIDIGQLVLDSNVYYSVTKNLTNCTISNSTTEVIGGQSYSATITANSGYTLKSVNVTMGGVAVTVSGGNINIPSVTGDIVITAAAEQDKQPTNFFKSTPTVNTNDTAPQDAMIIGGRFGSDNGYRTNGGTDYLVSNYIPITKGDEVYVTNLDVSPTSTSGLLENIGDTIATAVFTSSDGKGCVTDIDVSGAVEKYKIAHDTAKYVRFCGIPTSNLKINSSASTVDTKYDCSQIIVNVKRNGEWL